MRLLLALKVMRTATTTSFLNRIIKVCFLQVIRFIWAIWEVQQGHNGVIITITIIFGVKLEGDNDLGVAVHNRSVLPTTQFRVP
jgi:hypothetical protein